MRKAFILVVLIGCNGRGCGRNDDPHPSYEDDTAKDPVTTGFLSPMTQILGDEVDCQVNVTGGQSAITGYSGDEIELEVGDYSAQFGIPTDELFEERVDEVNDIVDNLPLHEDGDGVFWAASAQDFTVVADETTPVTTEMSMVPAFCAGGAVDCADIGWWTCKDDGKTYQDFISVKQGNNGLTIEVPCIGEMDLKGDHVYLTGAYEGTFITSTLLEVLDIDGDENDTSVTLWAGDGDEPE